MRDAWERLRDMMEAVRRIEKYASEGRRAFNADELIQVYILHYLQVLGEAAYKIPQEFQQEHSEVPWKSIQGMRHILVHDYFQVDPEVVWGVVEKDLPDLKRKIRKILEPGVRESPAVYNAGKSKIKKDRVKPKVGKRKR